MTSRNVERCHGFSTAVVTVKYFSAKKQIKKHNFSQYFCPILFFVSLINLGSTIFQLLSSCLWEITCTSETDDINNSIAGIAEVKSDCPMQSCWWWENRSILFFPLTHLKFWDGWNFFLCYIVAEIRNSSFRLSHRKMKSILFVVNRNSRETSKKCVPCWKDSGIHKRIFFLCWSPEAQWKCYELNLATSRYEDWWNLVKKLSLTDSLPRLRILSIRRNWTGDGVFVSSGCWNGW